MIGRLRRTWKRATAPPNPGIRFDRPLVVFQSDDWGRAGVRDREGWLALRAAGVGLGDNPYDSYSLETADDLTALAEVLGSHRDSSGRKPSIVMNFIMANVDFDQVLTTEAGIPLLSLAEGLPGRWERRGLFEAYREGVREGIFFPALHGLTHFCTAAIERALASGGERRELIHKMWSAGTPYIHWRMPWIGYEYWDAELEPERRGLSLDAQQRVIHRAAGIYQAFFGMTPFSACAPGYRANQDTIAAWFREGIRVVQNGPGDCRSPFLDPIDADQDFAGAPSSGKPEVLHIFRAIEMEPATAACDIRTLMAGAEKCFHNGIPAVVSVHSINFHSTIRDNRSGTLALLGEFLAGLEDRWPDLLYVNDADLFRIATEGFYLVNNEKIDVGINTAGAKNRR